MKAISDPRKPRTLASDFFFLCSRNLSEHTHNLADMLLWAVLWSLCELTVVFWVCVCVCVCVCVRLCLCCSLQQAWLDLVRREVAGAAAVRMLTCVDSLASSHWASHNPLPPVLSLTLAMRLNISSETWGRCVCTAAGLRDRALRRDPWDPSP